MNQGWRDVFVDRMELKGCKPTLQNRVLFAVAGGGWRHTGKGQLELGHGLGLWLGLGLGIGLGLGLGLGFGLGLGLD